MWTEAMVIHSCLQAPPARHASRMASAVQTWAVLSKVDWLVQWTQLINVWAHEGDPRQVQPQATVAPSCTLLPKTSRGAL